MGENLTYPVGLMVIRLDADIYATEADLLAGKIYANTPANVNIIPTNKDMIEDHIDALINHVEEESGKLAGKTTITPHPESVDKDYVLDLTGF